MSESGRDRLGRRGIFVLSALVVTVIAGFGVAIAHQDGSPPAGPAPRPTGTPKPIPTVHDVASVKPVELLAGPAAKFDSSTGDWTAAGTGTALVRSTTTTRHGPGALQLMSAGTVAPTTGTTTTTTTATTPTVTGGSGAWSPTQQAKAGDRYVATAYIQAITAVRGARAELRFLDADGNVTDTEPGQTVTDALGTWTELPQVAAIAPKGTEGVQMGVLLPVVGSGAQHLVDDASIAETPGGSTGVVPPLTTYGSQIFDGNGKPLILRGLQRFGLEGGTKNPLPTEDEIAQLKGWGANEVRISLGEQKWLTTSCHYQAGYPKRVDDVVRWVTSRGMVALVNLHFASLGDCGTAGLTPMADSPGAVTFWQEVATRYKDNGLVAFDLFNEPQVDGRTWLDGGPFHFNGQTFQAAGMQQLYDTVRDTGALNLVVVSGLDFASSPPPRTVLGPNIAYGAHAYRCPSATPPQCTARHPLDPSPLLDRWVSFAKSYPVIVTEFGWPNGDDGTYNRNVIAFAEAHHWGWSGFAWDGGTGGLFTLVQAHPAHGDHTTIEPNSGGMPLVAGFARNTLTHAAT